MKSLRLLSVLLLLMFVSEGVVCQTTVYELFYSLRPNSNSGPIPTTTATTGSNISPWSFSSTSSSLTSPAGGAVSVRVDFPIQSYTNISEVYNESGLTAGTKSNEVQKRPNPASINAFVDDAGYNPSYYTTGSTYPPYFSYFTSNASNTPGSGLTSSNGAFQLFTCVEKINPPVDYPNTVNVQTDYKVLSTDRVNMGTVKYTFSRPVNNPILHISGWGGRVSTIVPAGTSLASDDNRVLRFSTEYELLSSGITLSKLSGTNYLNVDGVNITNTFMPLNTVRDVDGQEGPFAGSGSVMLTGTGIQEVEFKVWMRPNPNDVSYTSQGSAIAPVTLGSYWSDAIQYVGDRYTVSWTVTETVVVPVTLNSFDVKLQGCGVVADWESGSEQVFSRYELERSADAINFVKVGSVNGKGNSSRYSYVDGGAQRGTNYYRLKMVDKDGKFTYSEVKSVMLNCGNRDVRIMPTLVTSGYTMVSGLEQRDELSVVNAAGQVVERKRAVNMQERIDLGKQVPGVYYIIVVNDNNEKIFNGKVVKQ